MTSLDESRVLNQSIILRGVLATLLRGSNKEKKKKDAQTINNNVGARNIPQDECDGDDILSSDDDENLYDYYDDSDTNMLLVTSDDDDELFEDHGDGGDGSDGSADAKAKRRDRDESVKQKNYARIKRMHRHTEAQLRRVQAAFVQQPIYPPWAVLG